MRKFLTGLFIGLGLIAFSAYGATVLFPYQGGTGIGTLPGVNQILQGNSSGGYNLTDSPTFKNATTTGHLAALGGNSDQWNTAYSWGNHALAGYLSQTLANHNIFVGNSSNVATATSSIYVADNGWVSIGNPAPLAQLHVDNPIDGAAIRVESGSNDATGAAFEMREDNANGAYINYKGSDNTLNLGTTAVGDVLSFARDTGVGTFGYKINTKDIEATGSATTSKSLYVGGDLSVLGQTTLTNVYVTNQFYTNMISSGYASTTAGLFTQGNGHIGGSLSVDSGSYLKGLTNVVDLRATTLNSTTTNIGTLNVYGGGTLHSATTSDSLRVGGLATFGGNVGIGITAPVAPLSFANAAGDKISFYDSTNNRYGIGIASGEMRLYSGSTGFTSFGNYNETTFTERMRINSTGLGVGITAPSGLLEVATSTHDNMLVVSSSNGYVGIGTATPNANLNVIGTFAGGTATTYATGTASFAYGLNNNAGGNYSVAIGRDNKAWGLASVALGYFNKAAGSQAVAIGDGSVADGYQSVAIGYISKAIGTRSRAMGREITVSGTDSFGIALNDQNGTEVSQANTMAILGGYVGVGTTTPNTLLSVAGNSSFGDFANSSNKLTVRSNRFPIIEWADNYATNPNSNHAWQAIGNSDLGALQFRYGNSTNYNVMTMNSDGKVGIGTAAPSYPLHIASNSLDYTTLMVQNTAGTGKDSRLVLSNSSTLGNDAVGSVIYSDRTDTGTPGSSDLIFSTSLGTTMTERMRILSTGKIGIGTASPYHDLSVMGASPTTWSEAQFSVWGSETNGAADTGGTVYFGSHNGSVNVGVGYIRGMKENSTVSNNAGYMAFGTRVAGGNILERMRITSTGSVGIATTTPGGTYGEKLTVVGKSYLKGDLITENATTTRIDVTNGTHGMRVIPGNTTTTLEFY